MVSLYSVVDKCRSKWFHFTQLWISVGASGFTLLSCGYVEQVVSLYSVVDTCRSKWFHFTQ